MSVLYVMLPVAVALAGGGIWMFVRAVRSGQFDDLDTPALRLLIDDDTEPAQHDRAHDGRRTPRT